MNTSLLEPRQQRGLALAQGSRLKLIVASTWAVPSQSHAGSYIVDATAGTCTCPDHELRGDTITCKHRWAVEFARHRVAGADGAVVTDTVRVTYRQDWATYNMAQKNEKEEAQFLLRALCDAIQNPRQGNGRPRTPVSEVVFAATMKTYVGMSGRRAESDLRACFEKGLLRKVPSYNTIFEHMEQPEITPLLKTLVRAAAVPLACIEKDFAPDGTGFSSQCLGAWREKKHKEKPHRVWVKLHAICGVKTHVITAAEVTDSSVNDNPLLPLLVRETAENFSMETVCADKGYLGASNFEAIEAVGAKPFIAFKTNSKGDGPEAWTRAYHQFAFHRDEWLTRYHQRSNVESMFSAMKRKFGDEVKAKTQTAMFNEVLLKCLCHNLSCLVHAAHKFGIDPTFPKKGAL